MITQSTIDALLKDQRDHCWKCWCGIPPYHVHHAIYTKDIRFKKWLDMENNLILLCPKCHANHGALSNIETRREVWEWKKKHGYEMDKWHESIPLLVKDIF